MLTTLCLSLCILTVFFIVLVLYGFVLARLSARRKRYAEVNRAVDEAMKNECFEVSQVFYVEDAASLNKDVCFKQRILVDEKNKKVCLIDYVNGKLNVINSSEILGYEVYENNANATFGGGASGWSTGLFGAETQKKCQDLRLIVRLKNYQMPQIVYVIIRGTDFVLGGIQSGAQEYKLCVEALQKVISFLEIVKKENEEKNDF